MVYCAGHGLADQQQYFVMNQRDPKQSIFGIEMKLRGLANLCEGKCSVLAIYDMCRTDKTKFPQLMSRGQEDTTPFEDAPVPYFQISGAAPCKTVKAASVLAERVYKRAEEKAR